jgi:LmbE family N-acetylglucosaminyl deacetylase
MHADDCARSPALRDFLRELTDDRRRRIDAARIAVVVAHPDDETLGCGATLSRLRGARIIVVTDGAPRDLADAKLHGFATVESYAQARRLELFAALSQCGIAPEAVTQFAIADQGAADSLCDIARRLAGVFRKSDTAVVLTHAYEGGHPDHDATAFAVHAARALCRRGGQAVDIIEMPYYRAAETGEAKQSFDGPAGEEVVWLNANEAALKGRMLACYATQSRILEGFSIEAERFRPAADYDFAELPNGGRLLYEAHEWNMSAARWRDLVSKARARLDER